MRLHGFEYLAQSLNVYRIGFELGLEHAFGPTGALERTNEYAEVAVRPTS